jgi:hypothetical protein
MNLLISSLNLKGSLLTELHIIAFLYYQEQNPQISDHIESLTTRRIALKLSSNKSSRIGKSSLAAAPSLPL